MIRFAKRFVVPRISIRLVPKGPAGTLATAELIARMIREDGAKDFFVRQTALRIFRQYGVRPKDRPGEVYSLFSWVKKNIPYRRDIYRVETLHSARRTLELRTGGDCDDFTILLGSLLMSTGHPVRLALVGFRPDRPHRYSHIYPEVLLGGRWVALDATMNRPMGWAPPAVWKRIHEIRKEEPQCSSRTV